MQTRSDIHYSAFERRVDDNYPTIDTRCVDGLLKHSPVAGKIVDVCAREGSAIVGYMQSIGKNAKGASDAFAPVDADWVVTNPPFTRGVVDKIVYRQIERVDSGEVEGLAILVRGNWDFAKTRVSMFAHSSYMGQIKLLFRPWWTNERAQGPKHNYVWHLWRRNGCLYRGIWYYVAPYDPKYATRRKREDTT